MADWDERDHPRDEDGRFTEKPPDWAERLSGRLPIRYDDLDRLLEQWFQPARLEARQEIHPRSGMMVRVGTERRLTKPPEGQREGPAFFEVHDFGPLDRGFRMGTEILGEEPVAHVYRAVSIEEWRQAQERGYIESDRRGVLAEWEGTNAAVDPRDAASYLPRGGEGGVILKIRVQPGGDWFVIGADQYVRTRGRVPIEDVEAVSPRLFKDPASYALYLRGGHG